MVTIEYMQTCMKLESNTTQIMFLRLSDNISLKHKSVISFAILKAVKHHGMQITYERVNLTRQRQTNQS